MTPEKAEKILDQTKYETAPNTVKIERKKKAVTKEVVSPTPSQKKTARERRRLNFDDISSSSEDEVLPTPPPASRRKAGDHWKKTKVKMKAKASSLQAANGQRNTSIFTSSTDESSDEGEQ